mmetsp:Transcript_22631/g.68078  ORF Transcript_22631/g.68078 Transcript_22631/m.68078 type:complete len:204 (+) Transcript_22631:420-1031(+)
MGLSEPLALLVPHLGHHLGRKIAVPLCTSRRAAAPVCAGFGGADPLRCRSRELGCFADHLTVRLELLDSRHLGRLSLSESSGGLVVVRLMSARHSSPGVQTVPLECFPGQCSLFRDRDDCDFFEKSSLRFPLQFADRLLVGVRQRALSPDIPFDHVARVRAEPLCAVPKCLDEAPWYHSKGEHVGQLGVRPTPVGRFKQTPKQ